MYQYRQIIFRLRQGDSIRGIAQAKLADRKKIRRINEVAIQQGWLNIQHDLPTDEELLTFFKSRKSVPQSALTTPYKDQIEEWVKQGIQASTIHAALQRQYGFSGSYNAVQRLVKRLKDQASPVTMMLDFQPGECAQVDFGAGPKLVHEPTGFVTKTWIFVMVLAWSRHMYAEIVLKQDVETWLGCHRRAFEWFNGLPKKITIDNAKCAITKACYHDPVVQRSYGDCAEGYGFIISACPPYDPQKKGRVESGVKYVKNAFVPLRSFRDLVDANQQLRSWLLETAGNRIHGSTHEKPLTLFETERHLLKPLPDQPPELAVWEKVTVHGNCHVQFLKCYYSAPFRLVRQELWLRASETTVRLYRDHELVALHPRLFKYGSKHSLNEHLPPNALAYCMRDPQWCLEQARHIGIHCEQVIQQLLFASVVDYLRGAQGIIGLQKKYGNVRLDAACKRALSFQSGYYKTVKSILQQGLEYAPLPENKAFDALAEAYTGKGRFCRDTSTLLQ
ncbi:MAG: IS21 family transposase [Gammaproteobacteria bacterium]|nr:IS21 family transposase [Gammaproteobacteria bacterium]